MFYNDKILWEQLSNYEHCLRMIKGNLAGSRPSKCYYWTQNSRYI